MANGTVTAGTLTSYPRPRRGLPEAGRPRHACSVSGWQVPHLVLGEVEPDSDVHPGYGGDGDGDFLAAPQVPLLEQHVGHPVVTRIDEEALHPPDLAVDGVDRVTGPHLVLTQRNNVFDHRPAVSWRGHGAGVDELSRAADAGECLATDAVCQARAEDATDVADALIGCVQDLALLRMVKLVELRERAAQPDLAVRRLGQVGGDEPPGLRPVPVLDDQVGDRLSGRVEDQALDFTAVTIGAACPGSDREFHFRRHCSLPFSGCWLRHGSEPAAPRSKGVAR